VNDGAAIAAQAAATALYTTLASTGGATALGAELGGASLGPGVYSFASTANIAGTTALTLNGAGTYIFQVGSALTANVASTVILLNGASACNIFWQVTSAATLNGVSFAGTVVAQAGITLGVGAALSGRALTTATGAVTMSGGNTVGGCSSASGGCPVLDISPPTLPNGTVGLAYSQQLTGTGGTAPYAFSVSSGLLPDGLTLTPTGLLAGTPTTAGTFTFTLRVIDSAGCPGTRPYTITITTAVPTMPQVFFLLLAVGLMALGYLRLRRRA
jgi:hypothetical protein